MAGDAEVIEAGTEQALARIDRNDGVMLLATLSQADFDKRLAQMVTGRERIQKIQRSLMVSGVDYGLIPGTGKKPSLLKPGAETLAKMTNVVPSFDHAVTYGDGDVQPVINVRTTCNLHIGSKDGAIVGEGIGAANSHEKKYRYRSAQKACPSCGVEGAIRRSKYPPRDNPSGAKGWYCHDKAGGCGTQFEADDPAIVNQEGGQVDNPDPFDVENTLLKMSAKRSFIDAMLRFTATSGLFTQDVEDVGRAASDEHGGEQGEQRGGEQRQQQNGRQGTQARRTETQAGQGQASRGDRQIEMPSGDDARVNNAQVKAFWKFVETQNFNVETVARRIKDHYHCASSNDLTVKQLAQLRTWITDGDAAGDGGTGEPREAGAEG